MYKEYEKFREKTEEQMQLGRQLTALEEHRLWQFEQGTKLKEEMDREKNKEGTGKYDGIRAYHEYLLTSVNTAQVNRELEEGPPAHMTKAEKKLWKEKMGIIQKMAQERDAFFAPIDSIRFMAEEKLKQCRTEGWQSVSDYAQVMWSTGQNTLLDFQDQPVKDEKILEEHPEIAVLKEIAAKLKQYTPETITQEKLKELTEEYKQVKRSAGATSEAQLEEAVNFSKCEAGYVFLFHNVVSVLTNCLDKLPMDQVNLEYFSKLCGLEKAFGRTMSTMKISDDYKQQSKAYQEEEARKQQEQLDREAKERLEARRAYLRTGIYGQEKPTQWLLAPYAQIMEQELGERFTKPDYTMQETVSKVKEFEAAFRVNQEKLQARVAEHPSLIFQVHQEQALAQLKQEINKNRLYLMEDAAVYATVDQIVEGMAEELNRCQQRKEYLATIEKLKDFLNFWET